MSIYTIWIPGEKGYKEHYDRMRVSGDHINALKEQSLEYKNELRSQIRSNENQTSQITASNSQIIASNLQIISSVERGLDKLAQVTEKGLNYIAGVNQNGFAHVTSSIEAMHSDMNYFFGTMIQTLEYQNDVLNRLFNAIISPYEVKIREYYRDGCKLAKGGELEDAVKCFKHIVEQMELGWHFFPAFYQLGRLYSELWTNWYLLKKTGVLKPFQ